MSNALRELFSCAFKQVKTNILLSVKEKSFITSLTEHVDTKITYSAYFYI